MGAEPSCQESFKMRIILLLTVFTTLGLCQRQSPPRTPLTEPPQGQRCAGRNFNGRRCCTPESPCGYGEGDCDGPLDGGANDGHRGCQGDLVCGSNNCKKFGTYFHEKDDCCDLPETLAIPEPLPLNPAGVPLEPPAGQRCAGRNYNGKRVHQQISGRCRKTRTRKCVGPQCGSLQHSEDLQEQYCRESDCDAEGFAEEERFFF